jgi:hypothetical protein
MEGTVRGKLEGAAEVALYCAHRTSTASPCAFCEQGGHLAVPFSTFCDRALREHRRSSGSIPSSILRAQMAIGRSPASNCTRSSGTALCATCSIGQACASGLGCLLSVIRPPRPNQSWECRAMGCPSPQSPGMFFQRFPEGRHTCQQWNR